MIKKNNENISDRPEKCPHNNKEMKSNKIYMPNTNKNNCS